MEWHPTLNRVARSRAWDMARRHSTTSIRTATAPSTEFFRDQTWYGVGHWTDVEYVFDLNPCVPTVATSLRFVLNSTTGQGEISMPIRPDLDPAISVEVNTTTDLCEAAWTSQGVERVGNTFSGGESGDRRRFYRIDAVRVVPPE